MVKYLFQLSLESGATTPFEYSLDLTATQEDNPDQLFSQPEIQESMRQSLEKQTDCKISPLNLKRMIDAWKLDIREGYRQTTLTLALPSQVNEKINNLKEAGHQILPSSVEPDLSAIAPQGGKLPPLNFL